MNSDTLYTAVYAPPGADPMFLTHAQHYHGRVGMNTLAAARRIIGSYIKTKGVLNALTSKEKGKEVKPYNDPQYYYITEYLADGRTIKHPALSAKDFNPLRAYSLALEE